MTKHVVCKPPCNCQGTIDSLTREIDKLRIALEIMDLDATKPLRTVLRERREELGLRQFEFARMLNVKPNYLSMIETGKAPVPRLRLGEIAALLKLDERKVAAVAMLDDAFRKKNLDNDADAYMT